MVPDHIHEQYNGHHMQPTCSNNTLSLTPCKENTKSQISSANLSPFGMFDKCEMLAIFPLRYHGDYFQNVCLIEKMVRLHPGGTQRRFNFLFMSTYNQQCVCVCVPVCVRVCVSDRARDGCSKRLPPNPFITSSCHHSVQLSVLLDSSHIGICFIGAYIIYCSHSSILLR